VTNSEKFNALVARYAELSAASPEGVALALELDALKRDMAEERARTAPAPKKPRRAWRGRVPDDKALRPHFRRGAPSFDRQAAAANDLERFGGAW